MRKSTAAKDDSINNNTPVSPGLNGRQQLGGSYSSIVGSLQAQNGGETRTTRGDNPFKYGKDEMMQVYSSLVGSSDKITHAPLDFERYDQVTSPMPIQPASMNGLSEEEHALLAGNINSEQKPRRSEQPDHRQNGRRENRQNGGREAKKQEMVRRTDDDQAHKAPSSAPINGTGRGHHDVEEQTFNPENSASDKTEHPVELPRDGLSNSQSVARSTSRLAGMGVFDNASDGQASALKWQDEKDEDVLKQAMGYTDSGKQDIDRLTDLYQKQSLGGPATQPQPSQQTSRSYGEQAYNPLSNGLPDLFSKTPNPSGQFQQGQQQGPPRGGFMDSAPSPGLPMRQDPPMTARVMVMPDKLKWQYRDPTGQNQGPFSGLEMHDWYKAGFFQPNLLVKREEDEEFEPLSILVRRIGNQREPFLVPLPSRITPTAQTARSGSQDGKEQWPNGQNWSGGGQPPFPQSFPSFGTTLTAEQQNALERRKQEEQYLMHRQREFLQQQQMAQQMAAQRLLHHQNPYAHGGQSFGYGGDRRGSPFSSGSERQGSLNSFDMAGGGGHAGWGGYAPHNQNAHRGQYTDFGAGIFDTPKSEMADQTQREPERVTETKSDDEFTNNSQRPQSGLAQFDGAGQQSYSPREYVSRAAQQAQAAQRQAEAALRPLSMKAVEQQGQLEAARVSSENAPTALGTPSLTEQELATQYIEPAQVASLENVTAVPEVVSAASEAPSSPSTAPWAAAASTKGRSLREIQEVEAKKTALRRQAERRAALEAQVQAEALAQQSTAAAPAIVPLNWAAESNLEAASAGAAWKAPNAPGKKTLAQIQQEEENARRAKAAAQARAQAQAQAQLQSAGAKMPLVQGTRYADTAMKQSASWATVGSSGKASVPAAPRIEHRISSGMAPTIPKPKAVVVPPVQTTVHRPSDPDAISPEFLNWARTALKGLNSGVNFVEFLQLLLSFGTDGGKDTREIISDSIYANSATMDGRRFADEWSKRRKEDLKNTNGQNKSISELTSTLASSSAASNSNGWSDVVKTKPNKQDTEEEWNTSFKVQAKKGGKRK